MLTHMFSSLFPSPLPLPSCHPQGVLQEAVKRCEYWRLKGKDGKPNGLLGWWPKRAVTFVGNHDTGEGEDTCWWEVVLAAGDVCDVC